MTDIRATFRARAPLADPIETMRGLAVLMLVSFHVIGAGPAAGLRLDYPHPLRIFADLLIDLRMPLFAFIAGYVYGLRPIRAGEYAGFVTGKFKRLAIPGSIAMLIFVLLATVAGKGDFAIPGRDLWRIFVFPYAHFWFLQAILLIFLIHGLIELLTGNRGAPLLFGLACALFLLPRLPGNPFSINAAVQLFPFYLLGLTFLRHRDWMIRHRRALIGLCLALVVLGTIWNLSRLAAQGELSQDRRDLQSLAVGLGVCLLAVLAMPQVAALSWIGPPSFTIYLYHVLGTAGMRDTLHALGLTAVAPHFLAGLAGGILFPLGLHLLVGRSRVLRGPVLGLWPRSAVQGQAAAAPARNLRAPGGGAAGKP